MRNLGERPGRVTGSGTPRPLLRRGRSARGWGLLAGLLLSGHGLAEPVGTGGGQWFGLAGKSASDPNFMAAWQGCDAEAQRHGDHCVHIGVPGPAQPRLQDGAILQALAATTTPRLAGLAVSVTHSELLAGSALAQVAARKLPLVTFDSDLEGAAQALRASYIGPDNLALGRQLAALAQAGHPAGGVVCLQSGHAKDPNLNQRLQGVRLGLGLDQPGLKGSDARLNGEGGWREATRCPLYSSDTAARSAAQVAAVREEGLADVLIAVGHFPIQDAAAYRQAMVATQAGPAERRLSVYLAAGETTEAQQALLRDGWVRGMVVIDFRQMGRLAYLTLKRLANGQTVEPLQAAPTVVRRAP